MRDIPWQIVPVVGGIPWQVAAVVGDIPWQDDAVGDIPWQVVVVGDNLQSVVVVAAVVEDRHRLEFGVVVDTLVVVESDSLKNVITVFVILTILIQF